MDTGQWTSSSILEMQSSRARRVAGKRGERRSDDMAEAERREEDGPRDYMREMTVDRAVENAALLGAQSKKETKRKRLSKASGVFSFHDILGILNRDDLKDWFKSPTS